jgi:hypothetical protein
MGYSMFIANSIWRTIVLGSLLVPGLLRAQDESDAPPSGEKPDTLRFLIHPLHADPVGHSRYRHLELIDERPDPSFLGFIETTSYYDLRVVLAQPIGDQLGMLMNRLTDSTAGEDTLAVQLLGFNVYTADKNVDVCFRLNIFSHSGLYREVSEVDTVIVTKRGTFKSGYRQRMQDAVGTAFAGIIRAALTTAPDPHGDLYSFEVLRAIDEIKKSKLPLYRADSGSAMPDGVYTSYASFSRLAPDYPRFLADLEQDQVLVSTRTQPSVPLTPGELFAVVKDGKPYVAVGGRHYAPLQREGSDFYIIDYVRVNSADADMTANLAGWAVFFASAMRLPLAQVWGLTEKKRFWMKMDYRNGRFVAVRAVD